MGPDFYFGTRAGGHDLGGHESSTNHFGGGSLLKFLALNGGLMGLLTDLRGASGSGAVALGASWGQCRQGFATGA